MARVLNIVKFTVALSYLIVVSVLVSAKQNDRLCISVEVIIKDSLQQSFLDKQEIIARLGKEQRNIFGAPLEKVSCQKVEHLISQHPMVASAEAFKSINGKLIIQVSQRTPLLRIMKGNQGYYIDTKGKIMPLSRKFTARVPVATGAISKPFAQKKLFELASFLNKDSFLKSQIDQIYVKENHKIELIPLVGNQVIELGYIENLNTKFNKLLSLYTKGFAKSGWNQYQRINLEFNKQVVCTKN